MNETHGTVNRNRLSPSLYVHAAGCTGRERKPNTTTTPHTKPNPAISKSRIPALLPDYQLSVNNSSLFFTNILPFLYIKFTFIHSFIRKSVFPPVVTCRAHYKK